MAVMEQATTRTAHERIYHRPQVTENGQRAEADRLDAAAMTRVAAGDTDALRALYDRYGRMAYAIAYRIVGESQLAEECVQDVFVQVWKNAGRYDPARALLSTWLCAIARNRALDAVRSRQRRPLPFAEVEPDGSAPDAADIVVAADDAVRVAEAMAELPPAQLEVLQLAHFDGLSHAEIAERLQLPLGTVKGRMRLALDRMRNLARDLAPEAAL
jgi:RNA polymerase sigma-70 factor (ECF subfamily)